MLAALAIAAAALSAEIVSESPRTEGPEGASALSRIADDRYYCVDDRGGWLCEATIKIAGGGVTMAMAVKPYHPDWNWRYEEEKE